MIRRLLCWLGWHEWQPSDIEFLRTFVDIAGGSRNEKI